MKRQSIINFFVSVLLVILASSCKKEPLAEPAITPFKEVALTGDAKIILNATTDGQNLYCLGAYLNTTIDSVGKVSYMYTRTLSLDRLPAHPKYFLSFSDDRSTFYINSTKQSTGSSAVGSLPDANMSMFYTAISKPDNYVAINDDAQVLVNVRDKQFKYHLYLFSFSATEQGYFATLPTAVKKIPLAWQNSPGRIISIGTDFFVEADTLIGQFIHTITYKIDKGSNVVSTIPHWAHQLFNYNNKLHMVTGNAIYTSTDGGTSFTAGYNYDADLQWHYFRVLNNKIFVFVPHGGLGIFEFTPNGFVIKELENSGLEDLNITAVNYFNQKVYVSTTSGLYYLDWKDIKVKN